MNFFGLQLNPWFFWAGLACACVPLIIHLLNRRRYKVIDWAAMDFLKQALQRNRRIMQIRDLLLLALRTLAVFLFGLALSQPLWRQRSADDSNTGDRQPLHAVMIIDNSMSMGYEPSAGENLLARAKARANQFIDDLPTGSRVSVIPLCGASHSYSLDPYRTSADATSAVDQISVVDATTNIDAVARVAKDAAGMETNLAQRVVFLTDQQRANWDKRLHADQLKQFPEMQVVDVAGVLEPENSWISEFRMVDDIVDLDTPANFVVRLRHTGLSRRDDAKVSLWVNGVENPRRVALEPGTAETEVTFQHIFRNSNLSLQPGEMQFVPVEVTLSADSSDRLPNDNKRYLVVPVVSALPVVFIDEVADADENRSLNRFGESWQLRRWLAPIVDRNTAAQQIVRIVHVTIDEVDQELLSDARLVVVAGIEDPAGKVELLREYVQQGGQMLIAAGGDFSPAAWQASAWQGGRGILPVPLEPDFIGQIPGEDGAGFEWFELVYDPGLGLFKLVDEADAELAALYSEPFFFQAVRVGNLEAAQDLLRESEPQRLQEQLGDIAKLEAKLRAFDEKERRQPLTSDEKVERDADEDQLRELQPDWLQWAKRVQEQFKIADLADDSDALAKLADQRAVSELPHVLARFDNGEPYMVERRLGEGRVVFATSGIRPKWNTLARTNAMLLFDRLLRGMLNQTVPSRMFVTQENISFPLQGNTSGLEYELQRPATADELPEPEPLSVGFIDASTRGLTIHNAMHQGIYQITAYRTPASSDSQSGREIAWQTALAVNVDSSNDVSESELTPLTKKEFDDRLAGEEVPITWVAAGGNISLDGVTVRGQNLWMWLAFVVLLLLLIEISVLAWPSIQAATADASASPAGPDAVRAT